MKTYSVIVFGARGAGKSVFLASMFQTLYLARRRKFFISVDDRQQQLRLKDIYKQVITGNWLDATTTIEEWFFNVHSVAPNSEIVCRFKYIDYPGGWLTEFGQDEYEEFEDNLKEADAFLCFLDGEKILALMKPETFDKTRASEFTTSLLYDDLPSIFGPINQFSQSSNHTKPIHFIITKWDLLEEFGFSQIRDRLLQIDDLKDFIAQTSNSKIRLIPVSSVGSDFVQLQVDGTMKKIGDQPKPYQVEMPLVCVLPDKIRTERDGIIKTITQRIQETKQTGKQVMQQIVKDEQFLGKLEDAWRTSATRVLNISTNIFPWWESEIESMIESMENTTIEKKHRKEEYAQLVEELSTYKFKLEAQNEQFNSVLDDFRKITKEFDEQFPDSLLD